MSLWKFNGFEAEVDFTDADFMERLETHYATFKAEYNNVKKVGTQSEIIRAYCKTCFDFFDRLFGDGAHEKMFGNRVSMDLCLNAMNRFADMEEQQSQRYQKFIVHNGRNRENRRYDQKHGDRK